MKVLFISTYPKESASCRYRILQYFPLLERNQIRCSFNGFLNSSAFKILYSKGRYLQKIYYFIVGTMRRLYCLLFLARGHDLIFIHREVFPLRIGLFDSILKLINRPIVLDLDDAIFLSQPYEDRIISRLKQPKSVYNLVRDSACVIVCNPYLKDYLLKYNPGIEVIPTAVDGDLFKPVPKEARQKKLVIGWIGSHSTARYLESIYGVLQRLAKKYDFIFKVVGSGMPIEIPGVEVLNQDWQLEREIADFQQLDIGVYPFPDNEWVRGKPSFKTVEYMAVGIPGVISAAGVSLQIVKDGVNGFLASTQEEWYQKLALLIEDPQLRKEIGMNARKTFEEEFSLKANFTKVLEAIKTAGRNQYYGRHK